MKLLNEIEATCPNFREERKKCSFTPPVEYENDKSLG
jgi:hypothetical protein